MKSIKRIFAQFNEKLNDFALRASTEPVIIFDEEGDVDLFSTTAYTYVYRGQGSAWFC